MGNNDDFVLINNQLLKHNFRNHEQRTKYPLGQTFFVNFTISDYLNGRFVDCFSLDLKYVIWLTKDIHKR